MFHVASSGDLDESENNPCEEIYKAVNIEETESSVAVSAYFEVITHRVEISY